MALAALTLVGGERAAHGYTIASIVTAGCHEKITTEALRAVRLQSGTAPPLPANSNDRALIDDLEFAPDSDMKDLGGASLLVGVRDNDLQGRDSNDLSQLPLIHGDPSLQKEHCLRSAHSEEPDGSRLALADCHAFILERVGQALAGLDAAGKPDPTVRTTLPLYLSLRHGVNASLPTYYVRIGQALHAVEDSFTHVYRTADEMKITTVLDWVDASNGDLVEQRDGPPHSTELDRCDDPDAIRQRRRELATEAATAILTATLDPTQTTAQKMAATSAILDTYVGYTPGCTFDNGWCHAPEHAYGDVAVFRGCSVGGAARPRWAALLFAAALIFARSRRRAAVRAGMLLLILCTASSFARAASDGAREDAARAASPPPTTPVAEPGPPNPSQLAFGAYLGGSGSINYGAAAATLGARLRLSRHWTVGLDAEWNPWFAINGTTAARAGAFNAYGTGVFRLPLAYEKFNLRITGNLGMSRMLIALYGVPKGSTGIYAGLSPLGLEWKASRIFYVIVNPLNLALPVPQLSNLPFSYLQYRATIGIEIYAG
jgi:MYXO-CTERM domain-containing protein